MADSFEQRFHTPPDDVSGYTLVTCTHPYHEMKRFYVSGDDWQDNIRSLLSPYWVNSYTVIMEPMQN